MTIKCRSAGQAALQLFLAVAVSQVACQGAQSLRVIDGSPQAGYVKVNLNDRVGSKTHVIPQFPPVSAAHPKFIPHKTRVCLRVDCSYKVQAHCPKCLMPNVIDSRNLQFPQFVTIAVVSFLLHFLQQYLQELAR
jgi:hypothetical protein